MVSASDQGTPQSRTCPLNATNILEIKQESPSIGKRAVILRGNLNLIQIHGNRWLSRYAAVSLSANRNVRRVAPADIGSRDGQRRNQI